MWPCRHYVQLAIIVRMGSVFIVRVCYVFEMRVFGFYSNSVRKGILPPKTRSNTHG